MQSTAGVRDLEVSGFGSLELLPDVQSLEDFFLEFGEFVNDLITGWDVQASGFPSRAAICR